MRNTLEWYEGVDAWAHGESRATCPYRADGAEPDADKYDSWQAGWNYADDMENAEDSPN